MSPIAPTAQLVFSRPRSLSTTITHYFPGCGHGVVHRLVADAIDELGLQERTVAVWPVGCAVFGYNYFEFDGCEAAHGRAPAVATGIKRVHPELFVFTYQGDGDLAAIGTAEIVHAAARGENISVIFVNNAVYGMTGGQMAPTTLAGQKTTSTPTGRETTRAGFPIRVSEMLATLEGPRYITRVAVHNPAAIRKAGAAVRRAFKCQVAGLGFSLVEILSPCPTNWGVSPKESQRWLEERMIPYYPLGDIKITQGVESL